MVWLRVTEWLPLQSVASQVRVSLKVPGQVPGVVTSLTRFTVAPPQVSEAVGGVKLGVFGHWMVALAPAAPIVGAVVSTTVMVWCTWALWLPLQSVASQVRVSAKVPGQVPGVVTSLTRFTVAPPQVSEAVGGVKLGVAGHSMVALAPAAPIVGAVVSFTEMVWCTWALWLPLQSVASQVRVSVEVPGQVPGVVTSLTRFTVAPPQVSEAVGGVKLGVFGHWMVALAPAAPIVGAVVSTTVMVWCTWPLWLPLQSVASQVRVSLKVRGQVPGVVTSLTRFTVAPPQVSEAVGGVKLGVAGH